MYTNLQNAIYINILYNQTNIIILINVYIFISNLVETIYTK